MIVSDCSFVFFFTYKEKKKWTNCSWDEFSCLRKNISCISISFSFFILIYFSVDGWMDGYLSDRFQIDGWMNGLKLIIKQYVDWLLHYIIYLPKDMSMVVLQSFHVTVLSTNFIPSQKSIRFNVKLHVAEQSHFKHSWSILHFTWFHVSFFFNFF